MEGKNDDFKKKMIFTLIFVKNNNKQLLLGLKTRGFGEGKWNGFGGKLEENETINECAERELKEECNIQAQDLAQIGVVKYDVIDENIEHIVHIFTCSQYIGKEAPSEEMSPIVWYKYHEIPLDKMWPDTKSWLNLVLLEKYFTAFVTYNGGKIINIVINEVNSLRQILDF